MEEKQGKSKEELQKEIMKKDRIKRAEKILILLDKYYGENKKAYLNHENDWQLLIATILSAQCTDARVNIVTEKLFKKYTSISDFANADEIELMEYVRTTGFFRNKARNIIKCCQKLLDDFDGIVPSDIDDLTSLAGVGRKTANVVRGQIFKIPSVVVDTHVKRVSFRLGLVDSESPVKIEIELMEVLPKDNWINYNTQVIAHGRKICKARNPACEICQMFDLCNYVKADN